MILKDFVKNNLYKNLKVVFENEEIKIMEVELLENKERNNKLYPFYSGEISILEYSKKEDLYCKFGYHKMTKEGELWYLFYKNIKQWDKEKKERKVVRTMNDKTIEYIEKRFKKFGNDECIINPV